MDKDKMFTVYILRTERNTLYTGQTNNLARRLSEHGKTGKGSKYMRGCKKYDLVYVEKAASRSEALKREAEIKKMKKAQKEELIGRSNR